jgi:hypothetical protein
MTIDFTTKGKYFNPNLHFYVCSYGGSGSFMLSYYLGNFGLDLYPKCVLDLANKPF